VAAEEEEAARLKAETEAARGVGRGLKRHHAGQQGGGYDARAGESPDTASTTDWRDARLHTPRASPAADGDAAAHQAVIMVGLEVVCSQCRQAMK